MFQKDGDETIRENECASHGCNGIPYGSVDSSHKSPLDRWSHQESLVQAMSVIEQKYRTAAVHGVAIRMLPLQSVEQSPTEPSFSTQGSYLARSDIGRCNSSELEASYFQDAPYASTSFFFTVSDNDKLSKEDTTSSASFGDRESSSPDHHESMVKEESDDYNHLMNYETLKQTFKNSGESTPPDHSIGVDLDNPAISPKSVDGNGSSCMTGNAHCTAMCSSAGLRRSSSVTCTISGHHVISITPSQNGSNSFLLIHSSTSSSSAMSLTVITLPLLTSAVSPSYGTSSRARLSFPFSDDHSGSLRTSPNDKNNAASQGRRRKRKNHVPVDPTPIVPILLSRLERVGVLSLSPSLSDGSNENHSFGDSPILSTLTSFSN